MWSSEQDSNISNPNPRNQTFGSSSSSSRSSLSSNTSIIFPQTPRRTMEDVWKDISLMTPLQNHYHGSNNHYHYHHQNHHLHHHHHQSKPSFKGMILQDFLAGPPNRSISISPSVEDTATLPPIPPPNLPPTSLSLNSGALDFCHLGNGLSSNSSSGDSRGCRPTETSSFISPGFPDMIMGPASPGNILSFCSKKRVPEEPPVSGDRRQKRMIKNRESAARSRARKQAYTYELEVEVHNLTKENARLKKLYEELRLKVERQPPPRTLQRNHSSRF